MVSDSDMSSSLYIYVSILVIIKSGLNNDNSGIPKKYVRGPVDHVLARMEGLSLSTTLLFTLIWL